MRALIFASFAVLVALGASTSEPSIEQLIEQLGADSFEEREAATTALLCREESVPKLREALRHRDPEINRRATSLLVRLEPYPSDKIYRYRDRGRVDLCVEMLVRRDSWPDEIGAWQALNPLIRRISDKARKMTPRVPCGYAPVADISFDGGLDFGICCTHRKTRFITIDQLPEFGRQPEFRNVVRGAKVNLSYDEMCCCPFVVSNGPVTGTLPELLLANGPVNGGSSIGMVISDGHVNLASVLGCVIIANGDIEIQTHAINALLVATGNVIIHPGALKNNVHILEKQKQPLFGEVRFFTLADVGLEVEASVNSTTVESLTAGPLAKHGLQRGDTIDAVNGTRTNSANSLRVALRHAVALGGKMRLEIRREDRRSTITVPVREFGDF